MRYSLGARDVSWEIITKEKLTGNRANPLQLCDQ